MCFRLYNIYIIRCSKIILMKEIDLEKINDFFKEVKTQIALDVDERELIKNINILSSQIEKTRYRKTYLDTAEKLLKLISLNYANILNKHTVRELIPFFERNIRLQKDELLKEILYKSEKLNSYELLLDFIGFENFNEIVEIRNKKTKE